MCIRDRGPNSPAPPAGFVEQLLKTSRWPRWLRPLPYVLPDEKQLKGQYVMLGAVSYTHLDVYKRQVV